MTADVLEVEPTDFTINTLSTWTFTLNPTVAMGSVCYIKFYFPVDLVY